MLPITRSLFIDLQSKTSALLGREGHERQANATFHCIPTQRCNRPFCPLCQWVKAIDRSAFGQDIIVKAAADYESALRSEMPVFAFTVNIDRDVPIQNLRSAADRLAHRLSKMIEKRRKHVIGSLLMFETLPGESEGAVMEDEHAHFHCLIGLTSETAPALRGFRAATDFQKVESLSAAQGWIKYGTKSEPVKFSGHWKSLLSQPTTFMPRIQQLKNFRVCRSTGLFRMARAA